MAPSRLLGQWIWTRRDVHVFERELSHRPDLVPAVLVATVTESLRLRHGLDPLVAGSEAAVVVRFEASVDRVWSRSDDAIARELDATLGVLLEQVRGTGLRVREVQLDYDAPERRLGRWAEVVARLARGSLRGVPLWITSIPAHVEHEEYGELFRGSIQGHILQLFDTGAPCSSESVNALRARLARHDLPFRIGVAAFERGTADRVVTEHGCWARAASDFRQLPRFAGAWVFAASAAYEAIEPALARLAGER